MSVDALTCDAVNSCLGADEDYADDATWVLTSSFVILTMQSGFGLLEMGSSTNGFEVNIMMKNVVDVVFGALAYWLLGYGISYGQPSNPFMGLGDFAPNDPYTNEESGLMYSQYIFQFSFAATATTIVSGAVAMRIKFGVYSLYSFYAVISYAFVAHWIWAPDGWLRQMGVYDFAGGGPVHLLGGMNGLVAAKIIGARMGFFTRSRDVRRFIPSSPASTLFGLFMLWWGWIGFNCGSTFGITGSKWIVATRAAIITMNSSAAGGTISFLYSFHKTKRKQIRVHHLVNGILGSLVATSPTCAVVHTWEALIIGAIGAMIANMTNTFIKRRRIDDPVGAVGVHAAAGAWGLIAVGLFADSALPGVEVMDGLFRGGGLNLLGLQILAIVVICVWSFICAGGFFYFVGIYLSKDWRDPRKGLRISKQEELEGEDFFLHGIDAPFRESMRFSSDGGAASDSDDNEDQDKDFNSNSDNNWADNEARNGRDGQGRGSARSSRPRNSIMGLPGVFAAADVRQKLEAEGVDLSDDDEELPDSQPSRPQRRVSFSEDIDADSQSSRPRLMDKQTSSRRFVIP